MLYEKIRYANTIRNLYRLRSVLAHERHPEISSKIGFAKFSAYYYRLMKKLEQQNILDRSGKFNEIMTNSWLAELPTMVDKNQIKLLGNNASFNIFLALTIDSIETPRDIIKKLLLTRSSAYYSIDKLTTAHLIEANNSQIRVIKDTRFFLWLMRYLELCKIQSDVKNDVSLLFDTVPAYIDGPQAYYTINYEPGRPIGPADMVIKTYEPFAKFWESAIREVRYFLEYPKKITLDIITKRHTIMWLNGFPYNKKPKLDYGD